MLSPVAESLDTIALLEGIRISPHQAPVRNTSTSTARLLQLPHAPHLCRRLAGRPLLRRIVDFLQRAHGLAGMDFRAMLSLTYLASFSREASSQRTRAAPGTLLLDRRTCFIPVRAEYAVVAFLGLHL